MPASGWLAIGSVIAALAEPSFGGFVVGLLAASLAVAGRSIAVSAVDPRRWRGLVIGGVGALALAVRLVALPAPPPTLADVPTGGGPWVATVESVAPVRDGSQVATLQLSGSGGVRLAATLPRYPEIEPGIEVSVAGSVQPPPDDDPYGDYLRRTGISGTLRARTLEIRPAELQPSGILERLRRGAGAALAAAIPEPEAGLAAGIVVGLRDRVDRDLAADFTTVGASHIVAISGWNIAIVAASVAALGGGLARRRRALLTATAIVLYVAFAGASASVVRAAVMAGVVLVARETGRAGRAAAALGWAAVLLLLIDPHLVGDAGFQLSSLATAGILAWATGLGRWLTTAARGRLPGWLVECLAVSLAAQAATLPIVLMTFGRLAIISPVVNLAVVPLVAPAMAASGVALLGGWATMLGAPGIVAALVGLPAWLLLSVMVGIIGAGAGLPFASATLDPPWNIVGGALAAAIPAAVLAGRRWQWIRGPARGGSAGPAAPTSVPRDPAPSRRPGLPHRRSARIAGAAVAISLIASGLAIAHRPDGSTRITVLDVGQGDSILVEGDRGGRMLIDGGPDPDRLLIELDRRLPPWDRRLDVVVLTHPHEDHVAGLALLLARYRIGRVFEPGMRGPGPGYVAWNAALDRAGAPPRGRLVTGDRLAVDDLRFDVLWPDPGRVPAEPPDNGRGINDVSIVLLGEVDGRRILLTGDVEDDVDPILEASGPAASGLPQGGPPRKRDGVDGRVPRDRPAAGRRRVCGRGQSLRPSGSLDARPPRSNRCPRASNRHGRLGRSRLRRRPDACQLDRGEGRGSRPSRRRGRRPQDGGPRLQLRGTIGWMTVPGRVEAAELLLFLDPPVWFLRHARAVAEVASWLAVKTAVHAGDPSFDRALVEAAALLHDADKALPLDDPARALPHGDGSAAWLARSGHPELGPAVAGHPVTRLIDGRYDHWAATASREERIVAYADKRAGQRLEPMADRFASWARRYPGGWSPDEAAAVRHRAAELETEVCRAAGVVPGDVRRLRWTCAAIRAARGRA